MPALEVVGRGGGQLPLPWEQQEGCGKVRASLGSHRDKIGLYPALEEHPGRPRAPTGMKASNAKFKCQVDRDWIVLGSGTAWGAAGTTPGAQPWSWASERVERGQLRGAGWRRECRAEARARGPSFRRRLRFAKFRTGTRGWMDAAVT